VLLFGSAVTAQDILYTASGNKIQGKVTEINTTAIKYKDFTNIEGPTYVISKTDVVLIEFANGTTQVINANPTSVSPAKAEPMPVYNPKESAKEPEKKIKPLTIYYLNPNMLSINALALANGDITLIYDREILNNKLGITVLGGYNFNSRMGGLNLLIADSKSNAKKNYDIGLGINYFPKNTKRVQYFVGFLGKYMSYDYKNVIDTTNNQLKYASAKGSQLALMLTNGWLFRISPSFNFKFFGSFGAPINMPELKSSFSGIPKVYLGYCFGYRF
jgi:hypothetical protein